MTTRATRTTTGKARTETLALATPPPAAPRRKTAPRKSAALEGEIVAAETVEAPAKAAAKVPTITWRGRTIPVRRPEPEQLSVLLRTYEDLGNLSQSQAALANDPEAAERAGVTGSRIMRLLSRAQRGAIMVMADESDREWALDESLDGRLSLNDLSQVVPLALAALNVETPSAPRTGPQPKARRRA